MIGATMIQIYPCVSTFQQLMIEKENNTHINHRARQSKYILKVYMIRIVVYLYI